MKAGQQLVGRKRSSSTRDSLEREEEEEESRPVLQEADSTTVSIDPVPAEIAGEEEREEEEGRRMFKRARGIDPRHSAADNRLFESLQLKSLLERTDSRTETASPPPPPPPALARQNSETEMSVTDDTASDHSTENSMPSAVAMEEKEEEEEEEEEGKRGLSQEDSAQTSLAPATNGQASRQQSNGGCGSESGRGCGSEGGRGVVVRRGGEEGGV